MSRVFGDSTPLPRDIDHIHMLRDGVDCAVCLLSAQHSIRVADERAEVAGRAMLNETTELNASFERVKRAASQGTPDGMDVTARATGQIAAGARAVVDGAIRELESHVGVEVGHSGNIVDKARDTSANAVARFLERHAPPERRIRLLSGPGSALPPAAGSLHELASRPSTRSSLDVQQPPDDLPPLVIAPPARSNRAPSIPPPASSPPRAA